MYLCAAQTEAIYLLIIKIYIVVTCVIFAFLLFEHLVFDIIVIFNRMASNSCSLLSCPIQHLSTVLIMSPAVFQ